jgi:hypothetical protein
VQSIELPGGLWRDGTRHVRAEPLQITGLLERRLLRANAKLTPETVSATIALSYRSVGDLAMSLDLARELCVADRQLLMLRLAARVDGDEVWLRARCSECRASFDVSFRRTKVPYSLAGTSFPQVVVELGGWLYTLRVPSGADSELLATAGGTVSLAERLLRACLVHVTFRGEPAGKDEAIARLSGNFEPLETALEEVAPAVATAITTSCPQCKREQSIGFDPYALWAQTLTDPEESLELEVHTLAWYYHWSEQAILELERERRRRYVRLIDRQRGVYG